MSAMNTHHAGCSGPLCWTTGCVLEVDGLRLGSGFYLNGATCLLKILGATAEHGCAPWSKCFSRYTDVDAFHASCRALYYSKLMKKLLVILLVVSSTFASSTLKDQGVAPDITLRLKENS